jgi:hypothetical protein
MIKLREETEYNYVEVAPFILNAACKQTKQTGRQEEQAPLRQRHNKQTDKGLQLSIPELHLVTCTDLQASFTVSIFM